MNSLRTLGRRASFWVAAAVVAQTLWTSKWHTYSGSEVIVDGLQLVPLPGHTPEHTG
jgi:glyoxylase-like metal-dependent hydrolase (beta-lactamase superfamily II)